MKTTTWARVGWLTACLFLLAHALASASEVDLMPVEEVRAGMTGKARTVFSGSMVEEFDVEILGVLENWRPGGDLILARAYGESVERTGIASGMSGTPVYIDGKLVGAIAYSWPFSKEPIAGVTPIGEMLAQGTLGGPDSGSIGDFGRVTSGASVGAMVQIETPLLVSGFHPAVQEMIENELQRYNMTVAQTGSAGESRTGKLRLVPGAPLAAHFVTGDASASAIGTVTHVEGSKVLGFGHGLLQSGRAEIPMGTAYIHAVLPSLSSSLKLGSASDVVGTITMDGAAGVVGEVGAVPELVPVHVTVETDGLQTREFNFGIMRHSLLTPSLAGWSVASAALTGGGSVGEITVQVQYEIELEEPGSGTRRLSYGDVFFSGSPAAPIAQSLSEPLRGLLQNRFADVEVLRVACRVSVEHVRKVAEVDEIYVSPQVASPGDSVLVTVRMNPFRGKAHSEHFVLHIPATCSADRVKVRVCSAPEMRTWEEELTARRLPPEDLEQMMLRIATSGRGDRLECVAFVEGAEAGIKGESFPSPPASFSTVVGSSQRAGAVSERHVGILDAATLQTDYVVWGCRTASLGIDSGKSRRLQ
ncbi:MAG: hypothetical protein JSW03_08175 [Candidatus Eiseniibacteriota bacterium]|nr:MAG: hypothetical protein JSW03_08175 [Candidatus Eisenbacteria bacterium]